MLFFPLFLSPFSSLSKYQLKKMMQTGGWNFGGWVSVEGAAFSDPTFTHADLEWTPGF